MKIYDVILIGLALSMDACALTIANCTAYKKDLSSKKQWSMPISFALFQGIMPIIGYYFGSIFYQPLKSVSGYLSAAIFFILTLKIIIDIVKNKSNTDNNEKGHFGIKTLIVQSVATSIDALIIGISLRLELSFSVWWAILIISSVTFLMVSLSLFFGRTLGKVLGKYASYFSAAILLALAIKSLIEAILG